ncbi:MAG: ThiF family adenylyltransferase, partial [Thermococcus sp.]
MLSERELERYDRQIMIFGEEGQEKLKRAKVAVVGVGG